MSWNCVVGIMMLFSILATIAIWLALVVPLRIARAIATTSSRTA